MSNYSQITSFTPKDALPAGDPEKVILGSDLDPEFAAISAAIASKAPATGSAAFIQLACSDLTTALTTGTSKGYFRAPAAITLTEVRASLLTASSSGLVTINVKNNGTTIFSTKVTIDANEKTSVTAATPAVLSTTAIASDDLITVDIDGAGTNAAGLIVTLIGN